MSEDALRVLLVDDEASLREPLAEYLQQRHGYMVDVTADGRGALSLLAVTGGNYDVALVDEVLTGDLSGFDVLREIKTRYPDIEVIVFTAWGTGSEPQAISAGAFRYFAKPFSPDHLALTIRYAAEKRQARVEGRILSALQRVSTAINSSLNLDEILRQTCQAAVELFGVDHSGVALFEQEYLQGRVVAEYPERLSLDAPGLVGTVIPVRGIPFEERMVYTKEVVNIPDLATETLLGPLLETLLDFGIRAMLIVPVVSRGTVIGSLGLDVINRPRTFSQNEIKLCKSLANQVAVAIENARLFREIKDRVESLETLQHLLPTVTSSLELGQVLEKTCQAAVKISGADHSGLVLFEPDLARGKVVAEYPIHINTLGTEIQVLGVADEERLIKGRDPLIIYDVAQHENLGPIQDVLNRFDIRSILIVPVISAGKIIGSFSLDAIGHSRLFTPKESELCKTLAVQVAAAIENAQLFGRLQALGKAGQALTSTLNFGEVLERFVDSAMVAFPAAQRGSIHLYDEQTDVLYLSAHTRRYDFAAIKALNFRPGEGIAGWVYMHRQPVVLSDAVLDPRYKRIEHPVVPLHKSMICVPLLVKEQIIGTLCMSSIDRTGAFNERDAVLLAALADQAAIAIENARLFDDNTRHIRNLEHMRDAIEKMDSAARMQDVLQQIVISARQVLEADFTLIWPYDEARDRFFPEELVATEIPAEWLEKFKEEEPEAGRTTRRVLDDGYIAVTEITSPEAEFIGPRTRESLKALSVKSFQGIRLDVGEDKLGVLFVDYKETRSFSEEEKAILEAFIRHAALALKKARLLDQVNKAKQVAGVVAHVTVLGDHAATLSSVAYGTREVVSCDAVTLYVYDQTTGKLNYPPTLVGVRYPDRAQNLLEVASDSIVYVMLQRDELYIVERVAEDPFFKDRRFARDEGIESCVAIPLKAAGQKVGVMFVNYCSRHRFTADELLNIELFANQAAVAIRNAQLYEEVQRRFDELKQTKGLVGSRTTLAWMGMATNHWRHIIEGHAINIRNLVTVLKQELSKTMVGEKLLRSIEDKLSRIDNLAMMILEKPVTPPLSSEEGVFAVAVNDLVQERLRQLWQNKPYSSVHLQTKLYLDDSVTVLISREWLRRALDILIDNCVEELQSIASAHRMITVTTQMTENRVEIAVADTGRGIPVEIKMHVFKRQIEKVGDSKGLGMGLLIAQAIAETYGGRIHIDENASVGTTMVMSFPVKVQ